MAYIVWKHSGKNRYLVMRWKKRIDGVPTIVKEISIGSVENLAKIVEGDLKDIVLKSYNFGVTAAVIIMDRKISLRNIVNSVLNHHDTGMSPGDYVLLFIMNRLSDPKSKSGIERWMSSDYASTIYPKRGSQDFWNMMDRFTDTDMRNIMNQIRDKLISLGYDFSRIFVDASNMYTFMDENDMAKKGHNKKHRYDLNQISYYIAANYDYIPLYGEAYQGNVHDSKTFESIIKNIPDNSTVIFDRGYNSKSNIELLHDRKYIGALIQSDHKDLIKLNIKKDSFIETSKNVYGKDHRIIVYHSSVLEKKRVITFMKRFKKVYVKVKRIIETGDSDAMEKARLYLEQEKLNETIELPSMTINSERMDERFNMFGKNAIFTNISDMKGEEIIDLYRKRNRVEHCFRTINTMDIAFPLYHWTTQKISVHMFFSHIAYLFLALIYNEVREFQKDVSLIRTTEYLKDIKLNYAARGKRVVEKIECKSQLSETINGVMKLESIVRD